MRIAYLVCWLVRFWWMQNNDNASRVQRVVTRNNVLHNWMVFVVSKNWHRPYQHTIRRFQEHTLYENSTEKIEKGKNTKCAEEAREAEEKKKKLNPWTVDNSFMVKLCVVINMCFSLYVASSPVFWFCFKMHHAKIYIWFNGKKVRRLKTIRRKMMCKLTRKRKNDKRRQEGEKIWYKHETNKQHNTQILCMKRRAKPTYIEKDKPKKNET